MPHQGRTAPLQPGYSDFLAAAVGEEKNGMQLSLLSALVRLGLDPWEEADRLARMSRASAAEWLASAIIRLPAGNWERSDVSRMAARLIEGLPQPDSRPALPDGSRSYSFSPFGWPAAVCVVALAVAWMLFVRQ